MQRRFFADQPIFSDRLQIGQIRARTNRARLLTGVRVELVRGMSGAKLTVLGQFAARIGHVPVWMIIVIGGRRGQSRFPFLRQFFEIHGEMLKYHAIHSHSRFRES